MKLQNATLVSTVLAAALLSACPDEDVTSSDAGPQEADASGRDATTPDAVGHPDAEPKLDATQPDAMNMDATAPADSGADAGIEERMLRKSLRAEQVDSELARYPAVALFSNKEAVAIWQQQDFESMLGTDIRANTWKPADGWYPVAPQPIDGLLFSPTLPHLYGDSNLRAIATWVQPAGVQNFVCANLFDAATAEFGTAYPLYGLYTNPVNASIRGTFSSTGTPILAFVDEGGTDVWVARFDDATMLWGEARAVDAATDTVASVAIAGDTIAWIRNGTTVVHLAAGSVEIVDAAAGTIHALRAAGSELLYLATDAQKDHLWVRAKDATGAYGPRRLVAEADPNTIDADSLLFEVGARGDALAVWKGAGGISASVRFAFCAYGAAELIDGSPIATPRALAVDPRGHAMLVLSKTDDTVDAIRFFGAEWKDAMQLSAPKMLGKDPHVAADADGDIMIVWSERDPLLIFDSIWSARWD